MKLRPLSDFGQPPWIPIPTFAAANFLSVHPKTLLRWYRQGIGPEPEPREVYLDNQLYWVPAKLKLWWERQAGLPCRTFTAVCEEWVDANGWWMDFKWQKPSVPCARHMKRRCRLKLIAAIKALD